MELKDYYRDLLGRINHLDKLRHAVIAFQIGVASLFGKVALSQDYTVIHNSFMGRLGWFFMLTILMLAISSISFNLFTKGMLASQNLMIIEYKSGIRQQGLGYFSGRISTNRKGHILSVLIPDILIAAFLVFSLFIDFSIVIIAAIVAVIMVLKHRYEATNKIFEKKDRVEKFIISNIDNVCDDNFNKELTEIVSFPIR